MEHKVINADVRNIGVAVVVLIRKGDKVLMGRRKSRRHKGMWGFPGGHLEFGEEIEDCGIRENLEETGIKVPKVKLWTTINTIYAAHHSVVIFTVADLPKGQKPINKEPTKCEGWEWFRWNKLPSPLMQGIEKLVACGYDPFKVKVKA